MDQRTLCGCEKYRDAGYDFYTFTDHNVITEDPGIEGIVWMGLSVEDTKINTFALIICPQTFMLTKE